MSRRWLRLSTLKGGLSFLLLLSSTLSFAQTPPSTQPDPSDAHTPAPKITLTVLDPQNFGHYQLISKFLSHQTTGVSHVAAIVPEGEPELIKLAQSLAPPGTQILSVKNGHALALKTTDQPPQPPSPSAVYRVALALFRGGGVAVLSFVGVYTTQNWEVAAAVGLVSGLMSGLLQFHNIAFVRWLLRGKFFLRWTAVEVAYLSVARIALETGKWLTGGTGAEELSVIQDFVLQRLGLPIPEAIAGIAENTLMGMLSQGILDNANSTYFQQQSVAYFERAKADPELAHLKPDQLMRRAEYQRILLWTDIRTSLISAISMGFVLSNLAGVPYADMSLWVMTGMGLVAKLWVKYRGSHPSGPAAGVSGLRAQLKLLHRCSVLP